MQQQMKLWPLEQIQSMESQIWEQVPHESRAIVKAALSRLIVKRIRQQKTNEIQENPNEQ